MPVKRPVRSRLLAVAAAAAMAAGMATTVTALAYPGLGDTVTFSVGCTNATPGQTCSVSVCVTSSSGQPVSNDQVSFDSSAQNQGRITPNTTKTGGDGCVAGAQFKAGQQCGTVTLTAAVSDASAQTQVDVQCQQGHGHGANGQVAGAQTGPSDGSGGGAAAGASTGESGGGNPPATGGAGSSSRGTGIASLTPLAIAIPLSGVLLALLVLTVLLRRRRPQLRPRGGGSPEDPDEVVPGVLVGAAPRAGRRRRLARLGVTRVLDLRSEAAGGSQWPSQVQVERFPVADGTAPAVADLDALAARIEAWVRDGETVLVHCSGGIGRAATVAVALLMRRGYTMGEAYRLLRERRPRVAPGDAQLAVLRRYAQALAGGGEEGEAQPRPAA